MVGQVGRSGVASGGVVISGVASDDVVSGGVAHGGKTKKQSFGSVLVVSCLKVVLGNGDVWWLGVTCKAFRSDGGRELWSSNSDAGE